MNYSLLHGIDKNAVQFIKAMMAEQNRPLEANDQQSGKA